MEIDFSLSMDEIKKKYNLTTTQAHNIILDKFTEMRIKEILEKDFDDLKKLNIYKYFEIIMNKLLIDKISDIIHTKKLNELNNFMKKHNLDDDECYKILLSNFEFIETSDNCFKLIKVKLKKLHE